MLRSDDNPDVCIAVTSSTPWECCTIDTLDQHIRTLQVARDWMIKERQSKKDKSTT